VQHPWEPLKDLDSLIDDLIATEKMIANIGTKALDPKQFCLLRHKLCGHADWEEDLG
jgi:hypothetical protein